MVHGEAAAELLRRCFGKEWNARNHATRARFNAAQLSPQRNVKLLPSPRELLTIDHESSCVAGVAQGDAVFHSASKELCSVALSEFGPSDGCVGFIGGLRKSMLRILVRLVNREWSPAPREPAAAAASSSSAAAPKSNGCLTVKSFVEFASRCAEPKRSHLLSLVASKVPIGWKLRGLDDGCAHSCCGHIKLSSLVNLRIHASNEALHKHCDKSTCAIWKEMQKHRPLIAAAPAAPSSSAVASSSAAASQLSRSPQIHASSSWSSAAEASAAPRALFGSASSTAS